MTNPGSSDGARGFVSNNSGISAIGTLGGFSSEAYAVNNHGEITGSSAIPGNRSGHAFKINQNGQMIDLGTLGGLYSQGIDINSHGVVAGQANTADGKRRAFIGDEQGIFDLGTIAGNNSFASGLNDHGTVVGASTYSEFVNNVHAFKGDQNGLIDLGTLDPVRDFSYGFDINNLGIVVGESMVGPYPRAFMGDENGLMDIGDLGGPRSMAYSINDSGWAVGKSQISENSVNHAFLYDGQSMWDLNDLVIDMEGWEYIETAFAISNSSYITGYGINTNGETRAFLLSPISPEEPTHSTVPEPPILAIMGIGFVGLSFYLGRK